MEFRVLGPLEVVDGGNPLPLGRGKPRAVLALLLLNANRTVSTDTLVDDLWGDEPPTTAVKALQGYVSRIRKALPEDVLVTRAPGYAIEIEPSALDLTRFEQLVSSGRETLSSGNPVEASRQLHDALSLWRGPALAEFQEPFAQTEAGRLEELRLQALEERVEADLAQGLHGDLIGELETLVSRYPLRERFRAQLMLALYRGGRQAEALEVYQEGRRVLSDDLGIEPSSMLRNLERRILQQDEDLDLEAPAVPKVAEALEPPVEVPAVEPPAEAPISVPGQPERRQLTILFCDLAGSTALAGTLDPEDYREFLRSYQQTAAEVIERFGGHIAQYTGDGIVVYFGYPKAHEDDPIRAVRAALGVIEAVEALGGALAREVERELSVHAGIHTGLVVVGEVGGGGHREQAALGETPIVAARLEELAGAGTVFVSEETARLVGDYFQTEPLEPVSLKGRRKPIAPHRIVGQTDISTRFEAAARRGLTPYTGRSAELESLRRAFAKAIDGNGQIVSVSGEPGIGKSRLTYEFVRGLERDQVAVLPGRCQAFGTDISYLPFLEVLEQAFGLTDGESHHRSADAVIEKAREIDPSLERYLPYFLELLSLPDQRYRLPPRFMGEEKRRAFEESIAALVTVLSQTRPVALVLEDWHWADEASDSALRYLSGTITAFPILVLVNHRPEYQNGWAAMAHHSSILLRALEEADSERIIAACLEAEALPDGLAALIHLRTDGNALFIEEVCNALLEDGSLRVSDGHVELTKPLDDLALPESVQAVIRTRLDRLDPDAQEVLRLAAVCGREFARRILERISDDDEGLNSALDSLVAQDLIQQLRVLPEVEYIFRHVLTQVVVYETLLKSRRKELHAKVGAAMEDLYSDRLSQIPEALALHFDRGEVWDKAATYRIHAGVKAFKHHVIGSALTHFERARKILERHEADVEWRDLYDLAFFEGAAFGDRGRWPAAYRSVSEADRIARENDAEGLKVQALLARANAAFWAHMFDHSLRIAAEVERLVEEDLHARLGVVSMQALTNFMSERIDTALEKEREAKHLFRRLPNSPQYSRAAFVLGAFHRWRGENEEAAKYLRIAYEIDREKSGAGLYLQSLMHYCLAIGELGRYQEAIDLLFEGREYGLRADSLYGVLKIDNALGWIFQEIGNVDEATKYNELSLLETNEAKGSDTSTLSEVDSYARLNLGDLLLLTGDPESSLDYFESAFENARDDQYFLARTRWKPRCLVGLAEASLALGNVDRATALLAQFHDEGFADEFPFRKFQARALRVEAQILLAQDDPGAASALLDRALEKANVVGNPTQLWQIHGVLGGLWEESGETQRARDAYRSASEVVVAAAGELGETNRAGFLSSPPIRAVLERAAGR